MVEDHSKSMNLGESRQDGTVMFYPPKVQAARELALEWVCEAIEKDPRVSGEYESGQYGPLMKRIVEQAAEQSGVTFEEVWGLMGASGRAIQGK